MNFPSFRIQIWLCSMEALCSNGPDPLSYHFFFHLPVLCLLSRDWLRHFDLVCKIFLQEGNAGEAEGEHFSVSLSLFCPWKSEGSLSTSPCLTYSFIPHTINHSQMLRTLHACGWKYCWGGIRWSPGLQHHTKAWLKSAGENGAPTIFLPSVSEEGLVGAGEACVKWKVPGKMLPD